VGWLDLPADQRSQETTAQRTERRQILGLMELHTLPLSSLVTTTTSLYVGVSVLLFYSSQQSFEMPPHHFSSKEKIRAQSFFMLITIQPFLFASSISDSGKVPNLVSGSPLAGP
jgi:hypothetical protein